MNIDALSIGIVKRLIDNGYNTLDSILTISQEALLEIDGFKETLSNKIVKNIRDCLDNPVNLVQLMSASLAFGDGMSAKRLQNVVDTYPNILELDTITVEDIKKIKGFSDKTAQVVVSGLLRFKKFLLEHPYFTIQNPVVSGSKASANLIKEHALANKTIVITGVRDPEVNAFCETISCCKIGNVISGKVDIIVVPSVEYSNKKTTLAEGLGITRFTMAEFKEKYISS
jgi:NAD-dependent DNA ligase